MLHGRAVSEPPGSTGPHRTLTDLLSVQEAPMYIPRSFEMPDDEAVRFMREHPFAILVGPGPDVPLTATHLPLIYQGTAPALPLGRLIGHMARANHHWRTLDGQAVLAIFQGPHAYISPTWYGTWPDVPTWNYLAVHVHGILKVVPDGDAAHLVEELVGFMEPDSPILGHLGDPAFRRELQGVTAFHVEITRIEGKSKLGQNRPAEQRVGAVRGLRATGRAEAYDIANLMEATTTRDGDS